MIQKGEYNKFTVQKIIGELMNGEGIQFRKQREKYNR